MAKRNERVLVVGTTRDYIDHIRDRMPGRAVFLTDPRAVNPQTSPVSRDEELVCSLSDLETVRKNLTRFLRKYRISFAGIACFDCESLCIAAAIAEDFNLLFPSTQAVQRCRDKFLCKALWAKHDIACPEVCEVFSLSDILHFMRKTGGPVILKPRSGSGSELTFRCDAFDEAEKCYAGMLRRLKKRSADPLVHFEKQEGRPDVICEAFIDGDEYSCDLYFDGERAQILRLARKYFREDMPVGTAVAYEVPAGFPQGVSRESFLRKLGQAATALGLTRSLCMTDLVIRDGTPYLLEMSPRLGGDCLPAMIEQSCGVDMLELALDFAEGLSPEMPGDKEWRHVVGVRFHAARAGVLQAIRPVFQEWNTNIRSQLWLREPGDTIGLPPNDYDSWLLGHVVFVPKAGLEIPTQVHDLIRSVETDIC